MNKNKLSLDYLFPYLLLIGGVIGLVCSLILSHDTFAISQNSHFIPSCNLNPIINCGNVINASGDKIFGIPYPFYGIGIFGGLTVAGVSLVAGAKYKRWYWLSYEFLLTTGFIASYLLLIKSAVKIHSLCPFCLGVDFVTTTLFWYSTLQLIDSGIIKIKSTGLKKFYSVIRKHHLDLLILWFLVVIALIVKHFWYYYGKHL